MKRQIVRQLLMLLVLVLLAACGGGEQGTQPQTTGSAATPAAGAVTTTAATDVPAATLPAADTAAATTGAPAATTTEATAAATTERTAVATDGPAATTTSTEATTAATDGPREAGEGEFVNPVIDQDFPDPDVLKVGDTYYAYATNTGLVDVQVAKSTDLVNWQMLPDAVGARPGWAQPGLTWAPDVSLAADGETFVMYFTARDKASDRQCIGVATSDQPEGPFKSDTEGPFICQPDLGGSIDPSTFVDEDGKRYVLWKNDGNCCAMATWLYIQPVSDDGLTLQTEPTQLIRNERVWEGPLVEAPTLWKHDGKYYLFYSANRYSDQSYAVGYAVADAVLGPYTKPSRQPLLQTDLKTGGAFGPGGQDIVLDKEGDPWFVYHSWNETVKYRAMQIDELVWEGDTPVVKGPDRVPQPVP